VGQISGEVAGGRRQSPSVTAQFKVGRRMPKGANY
jgi:hypothetical protein